MLAAPRYALQYISLAHQHVDLACCARVSDVARVDVQACASEATPREPVLRSSPVLHASRYCFYKYLSTPTTFYSNVCAVFSFSTSGYIQLCASESTPREPVLRSRVGSRLHSSRFGAFVVLDAPRYALQYISLASTRYYSMLCARFSCGACV